MNSIFHLPPAIRVPFVVFLICLQSTTLYSQSYLDLAGVTYSYQQPFENINQPKFNTINQETVFLNLPLKIQKDYLMLTPYINFFDIRFDKDLIPFRAGKVTLSWLHQWKNERWKTAFVAIVTSSSNKPVWFEQNTFQAGGAILNTFTKNDHLKFKFGVYGNAEFFGPYFLPLLGVDWKINQRWSLFGVLPRSLNLEYKIIPGKIHSLLSIESQTTSYRDRPTYFIRVNDNHLKMIFDFYIAKSLVLSVEAGHSVLRDFRFGKRVNGTTTDSKLHYPDSYLLKGGLYFRISTESKN